MKSRRICHNCGYCDIEVSFPVTGNYCKGCKPRRKTFTDFVTLEEYLEWKKQDEDSRFGHGDNNPPEGAST